MRYTKLGTDHQSVQQGAVQGLIHSLVFYQLLQQLLPCRGQLLCNAS